MAEKSGKIATGAPRRRSIGEKLARARSLADREHIVAEWAEDWRRDQMDIVRQLERAIQTMDYDAFCSATGQLKSVTEKRFTGLASVLRALGAEEPS